MSKDAIVLLHGFDHDHRCWDLVVDEMTKLAPEVPVYAVDLPGRGEKKHKTARNPKQGAKSILKDLEGWGVDRAFLVGHSLAGNTLPMIAIGLGEARTLGQMYIAAIVPPEGKSFFTTVIPFRPVSWVIEVGCKLNFPLLLPKPVRNLMWCNAPATKEHRKMMNDMVVWDPVGIFGSKVTRKGMPRKNLFWLRTLRDHCALQGLQSAYRDNLGGVDEELYIDAPHDCMLTNPKEVAEIILSKYYQCLK